MNAETNAEGAASRRKGSLRARAQGRRTVPVWLGAHIKRYFLLVTTLPMLIASSLCTLAITGYYEYSNRLEIEYDIATMQRELSTQLESWEELLSSCAENEDIAQQMENARTLDEGGRSIITSMLAGRGRSVQLHLLSANGRFRYSTGAIPNVYQMPAFNQWPFFARIREESFAVRATNLSSYNAHPLALSVGTAVRRDGRVIGYAVLDVEQAGILDLLQPYNSACISDIVLISRQNMVVCSLSSRQKTGLLLDEATLALAAKAAEGDPSTGYVTTLLDHGGSGLSLIVLPDRTLFLRLLPTVLTGFSLLILCATVSALLMGNALSKRVTGQLKRLPDANRPQQPGGTADGYVRQAGDFEEIVSIGEELNKLNRQTRELLLSNQEKEQLLANAELNLLRAQMRPHFIYNVLNDVKSMAKLGRSQQVVALIVSFSALLRSTLSVHEEFATLSEEVDLAQKYVQMQNLRGVCPVALKLHVDKALEETEVPRLMLQPLIENAMLHGLTGHPRPILSVTAWTENGQLLLQVTDNGRGLREATRFKRIDGAACHEGVGLRNIAQRLRLYYGEKGKLTIRSKPNRYTAVRLCLPIRNAE